MKNGQIWYDTEGNDIQAHGGCIIKHADTYYWYGEHKGGETKVTHLVSGAEVARVDVIGVSCYSSKNLRDWKYEGLALEAVRYRNANSRKGVIGSLRMEPHNEFLRFLVINNLRTLKDL